MTLLISQPHSVGGNEKRRIVHKASLERRMTKYGVFSHDGKRTILVHDPSGGPWFPTEHAQRA